jgi:cyclin-dependent kinase-like
VAIKKFLESDEDENVRKVSLREVRILKRLRHDNVVRLLDAFRRRGRMYLVFELLDRTLLEEIDSCPDGIPEERVRRLQWQVVRAVDYCHQHGVIHRDIKPENVRASCRAAPSRCAPPAPPHHFPPTLPKHAQILLSKHGVVKLIDFGFARTRPSSGASAAGGSLEASSTGGRGGEPLTDVRALSPGGGVLGGWGVAWE